MIKESICYWTLFCINTVFITPGTLLKKRLWHRFFPVSFAKLSIAPFFIEDRQWLLLREIGDKSINMIKDLLLLNLHKNLRQGCLRQWFPLKWTASTKRNKEWFPLKGMASSKEELPVHSFLWKPFLIVGTITFSGSHSPPGNKTS